MFSYANTQKHEQVHENGHYVCFWLYLYHFLHCIDAWNPIPLIIDVASTLPVHVTDPQPVFPHESHDSSFLDMYVFWNGQTYLYVAKNDK